jgi:hypothetical protein
VPNISSIKLKLHKRKKKRGETDTHQCVVLHFYVP